MRTASARADTYAENTRRAKSSDRSDLAACFRRGNAALEAGRYEDAVRAFRVVVKYHEYGGARLDARSLARVQNNLGTAQMAQGHLGPAEKSFLFASRLDPLYADARVNLGRVLQYRDREAAQACYRRVLSEHPGYAPALAGLTIILELEGQLDA